METDQPTDFDNFLLKSWLRKIGPTRRYQMLRKIKNNLHSLTPSKRAVRRGLLQLVTKPYVVLLRHRQVPADWRSRGQMKMEALAKNETVNAEHSSSFPGPAESSPGSYGILQPGFPPRMIQPPATAPIKWHLVEVTLPEPKPVQSADIPHCRDPRWVKRMMEEISQVSGWSMLVNQISTPGSFGSNAIWGRSKHQYQAPMANEVPYHQRETHHCIEQNNSLNKFWQTVGRVSEPPLLLTNEETSVRSNRDNQKIPFLEGISEKVDRNDETPYDDKLRNNTFTENVQINTSKRINKPRSISETCEGKISTFDVNQRAQCKSMEKLHLFDVQSSEMDKFPSLRIKKPSQERLPVSKKCTGTVLTSHSSKLKESSTKDDQDENTPPANECVSQNAKEEVSNNKTVCVESKKDSKCEKNSVNVLNENIPTLLDERIGLGPTPNILSSNRNQIVIKLNGSSSNKENKSMTLNSKQSLVVKINDVEGKCPLTESQQGTEKENRTEVATQKVSASLSIDNGISADCNVVSCRSDGSVGRKDCKKRPSVAISDLPPKRRKMSSDNNQNNKQNQKALLAKTIRSKFREYFGDCTTASDDEQEQYILERRFRKRRKKDSAGSWDTVNCASKENKHTNMPEIVKDIQKAVPDSTMEENSERVSCGNCNDTEISDISEKQCDESSKNVELDAAKETEIIRVNNSEESEEDISMTEIPDSNSNRDCFVNIEKEVSSVSCNSNTASRDEKAANEIQVVKAIYDNEDDLTKRKNATLLAGSRITDDSAIVKESVKISEKVSSQNDSILNDTMLDAVFMENPDEHDKHCTLSRQATSKAQPQNTARPQNCRALKKSNENVLLTEIKNTHDQNDSLQDASIMRARSEKDENDCVQDKLSPEENTVEATFTKNVGGNKDHSTLNEDAVTTSLLENVNRSDEKCQILTNRTTNVSASIEDIIASDENDANIRNKRLVDAVDVFSSKNTCISDNGCAILINTVTDLSSNFKELAAEPVTEVSSTTVTDDKEENVKEGKNRSTTVNSKSRIVSDKKIPQLRINTKEDLIKLLYENLKNSAQIILNGNVITMLEGEQKDENQDDNGRVALDVSGANEVENKGLTSSHTAKEQHGALVTNTENDESTDSSLLDKNLVEQQVPKMSVLDTDQKAQSPSKVTEENAAERKEGSSYKLRVLSSAELGSRWCPTPAAPSAPTDSESSSLNNVTHDVAPMHASSPTSLLGSTVPPTPDVEIPMAVHASSSAHSATAKNCDNATTQSEQNAGEATLLNISQWIEIIRRIVVVFTANWKNSEVETQKSNFRTIQQYKAATKCLLQQLEILGNIINSKNFHSVCNAVINTLNLKKFSKQPLSLKELTFYTRNCKSQYFSYGIANTTMSTTVNNQCTSSGLVSNTSTHQFDSYQNKVASSMKLFGTDNNKPVQQNGHAIHRPSHANQFDRIPPETNDSNVDSILKELNMTDSRNVYAQCKSQTLPGGPLQFINPTGNIEQINHTTLPENNIPTSNTYQSSIYWKCGGPQNSPTTQNMSQYVSSTFTTSQPSQTLSNRSMMNMQNSNQNIQPNVPSFGSEVPVRHCGNTGNARNAVNSSYTNQSEFCPPVYKPTYEVPKYATPVQNTRQMDMSQNIQQRAPRMQRRAFTTSAQIPAQYTNTQQFVHQPPQYIMQQQSMQQYVQVPAPQQNQQPTQHFPTKSTTQSGQCFRQPVSYLLVPRSARKPVQQLAQQPVRQPIQQLAQQPVRQPIQQQSVQVLKQIVYQSTPTPQVAQQVTYRNVQQPVQQTVEQPMQQPGQQSIQQHSQQSNQRSVQQTIQQPVQQPSHQSIQQPVQHPVQQPAYQMVYQFTNQLVQKRQVQVALQNNVMTYLPSAKDQLSPQESNHTNADTDTDIPSDKMQLPNKSVKGFGKIKNLTTLQKIILLQQMEFYDRSCNILFSRMSYEDQLKIVNEQSLLMRLKALLRDGVQETLQEMSEKDICKAGGESEGKISSDAVPHTGQFITEVTDSGVVSTPLPVDTLERNESKADQSKVTKDRETENGKVKSKDEAAVRHVEETQSVNADLQESNTAATPERIEDNGVLQIDEVEERGRGSKETEETAQEKQLEEVSSIDDTDIQSDEVNTEYQNDAQSRETSSCQDGARTDKDDAQEEIKDKEASTKNKNTDVEEENGKEGTIEDVITGGKSENGYSEKELEEVEEINILEMQEECEENFNSDSESARAAQKTEERYTLCECIALCSAQNNKDEEEMNQVIGIREDNTAETQLEEKRKELKDNESQLEDDECELEQDDDSDEIVLKIVEQEEENELDESEQEEEEGETEGQVSDKTLTAISSERTHGTVLSDDEINMISDISIVTSPVEIFSHESDQFSPYGNTAKRNVTEMVTEESVESEEKEFGVSDTMTENSDTNTSEDSGSDKNGSETSIADEQRVKTSDTSINESSFPMISVLNIEDVRSISLDAFCSMDDSAISESEELLESCTAENDAETENKNCLHCSKASTVVCEICLEAQYCSKLCSELHWIEHYKDCKRHAIYEKLDCESQSRSN